MSTPIETNTEELQGVLNRMYNLPNLGGSGSSAPDLVIGLNVADTKMWEDGTTNGAHDLRDMTPADVSIISGSISAVAEKVKQGLPVKVMMNEIHFYWGDAWTKGVAEASHVSLGSNYAYPSDNFHVLSLGFFLLNNPINYTNPCYMEIRFNLETGVCTTCYANAL